MLTIRNPQMNAFGAVMLSRFVGDVASHLRAKFRPELSRLGVADGDLETFVRNGIALAGRFNVKGEADLRFFIECLAVLGPAFHDDPRYPWAREILNRPDWSGKEKVNALELHILFEVRPQSP